MGCTYHPLGRESLDVHGQKESEDSTNLLLKKLIRVKFPLRRDNKADFFSVSPSSFCSGEGL